jgi:hypothetical protein
MDDFATRHIPKYVCLDPGLWWRSTDACTGGVISHYYNTEITLIALPLHVRVRPPGQHTYLAV